MTSKSYFDLLYSNVPSEDKIITNLKVKFGFVDRLRILFGAKVEVDTIAIHTARQQSYDKDQPIYVPKQKIKSSSQVYVYFASALTMSTPITGITTGTRND